MTTDPSEYVSPVWRDGIFNDRVVFCTGGNGTICSAQVRAMVYLGANACIVGRNVDKTESMAKSLMTARKGSRVIGIGSVDVRSLDSLQKAVDICVRELGGLDFCMFVLHLPSYSSSSSSSSSLTLLPSTPHPPSYN
jgi:2,4-dienoyl-CoA reductase [(3E)-enoyl-CoA-producing], peroxisomal